MKIIIGVSIPLIIAVVIGSLIINDIILVGKSSKDGSLWIGSSDYAKAGNIYLVGESHAKRAILAEELKLWKDLYHNEGMRHYFKETSYYGAQWLNLWMKSDNDDILWEMRKELEGTLAYELCCFEYLLDIKESCPETIFHGTDVGHQYKTTGARYLKYLEDNGMQDTEDYRLTLEAIEQGKKYYTGNNGEKDHDYREKTMFENFKREYDKLGGISIFGVYGSAHTNYPTYGWNCTETYSMTTNIVNEYSRYAVEVNNLSRAYQRGELN